MLMTSQSPDHPPGLEKRFQQPEGWRWHNFTNPNGQHLRFGTVTPQSRIPDAVVICLPGLSEYAEKYYEVAHTLLNQNLGFWVMDWQGQGHSERALPNRHKRHSNGFSNDIDDLHYFLMEYVKHACVHPDVGRIPMVMLAHSMGGNIGMRYLMKHPNMFACAAFSAPMFGIAAARPLTLPGAIAVSAVLKQLSGKSYAFGGHDWSPEERENPALNIFSSDPARASVHNAWCRFDPGLQVGNITYGWLNEALRSCRALQRDIKRSPPAIPCLIATAGHEKLVDNIATRAGAGAMPQVTLLDLPDSSHEIMMERDSIRDRFFAAFADMLKTHKISEQLKPF